MPAEQLDPPTPSRYSVFAFLFASATIFFHAEQSPWFGWVPGSIPLAAAFWALLKPSSVPRLAVLVITQTAHAALSLPFINTNRTMQLLAGATLLAGLCLRLWAGKGRLPDGPAWLRLCETPLKLELLTIYFFAFWHKLNWDFLDPATSCGAALFAGLGETFLGPILPSGIWADQASIGATLLIEAALPVMLVFHRTRLAGFMCALVFHVILGIAGYYGFSATMIALLFLFAPASLTDWLDQKASALPGISSPWVRRCLAAAVVAASFGAPLRPNPLFYWVWAAWSFAGLGLVGWFYIQRHQGCLAAPRFSPTHPLLFALPAIAILNGLSPYLGLKTEYSFAMYSNLRTEGGYSNHLLLNRTFPLADYQDDLVQIVQSSDPELAALAREGNRVPYFWFRRMIAEKRARSATGISVDYIRNGAASRVANAELDPELSLPPTLLERKLLRFRTILPPNNNVCAH